MIKKVIAIDIQYAERVARAAGFPYLPLREIRSLIEADGQVDVLEMLITVIKRVPENDSAEAVANASWQLEQKIHALEMNGARTIVCPSKRSQNSPTGFKQSDDQRLMISTLSLCLRLRPDFLTFFGADGDYAALLLELRDQGIRTEVVARREELATELQRAAFSIIDYGRLLETIRQQSQ